MTGKLLFALTLLSALGCGSVAGIFFAFSTFVMNARARLPAAQGIIAKQSINVAVINPLFGAAFFGTAALQNRCATAFDPLITRSFPPIT
jgi:uncharacterized membrane protein